MAKAGLDFPLRRSYEGGTIYEDEVACRIERRSLGATGLSMCEYLPDPTAEVYKSKTDTLDESVAASNV